MNTQPPTLNPHPPRTDWRRVAARMRAELDRAATALVSYTATDGRREWQPVKLAGRPKELAELVVKATLARGRWQVALPGLEEFGEQVGIGKNHIRAVFHVLECARMVELVRGERGWTLTVFPLSTEWQGVTWRYEEKSLLDFLAALDRAPGQVQREMFDAGEVETTAGPAFTRARAEAATEQASSQNGNRLAGPVPKTGTGSLAVNSDAVLRSSRLSRSSQLSEEAVKPGKPLDSEPRARGKAFTGPELELLTKLRQELGEEDVKQWGGYWVKHFIRPMPHALGVALDELHARRQEGARITRPAQWVQATARHVAAQRAVHLGNDKLPDDCPSSNVRIDEPTSGAVIRCSAVVRGHDRIL